MEVLKNAIEQFLAVNYGDGSGYGYGYGDGFGYGYGDGFGYGYGYGDGFGSGSGSGYGFGDGDGDGSGSGSGYGFGFGFGDGDGSGSGSGYGFGDGDGSGYGDGDGDGSGSGSGDGDGSGSGSSYGYGYGSDYGSGSGDGDGLIYFNGHKVYYIDGMATVIERVHGNLAKGFTINKALTMERCCVVKSHNLFAHGKTVKDAEEALQDKIIATMDTDEKINAFLDRFKLDIKYPAKDFYEWHHKLTGSCEFGRRSFCKNAGIDIENDTYTVQEFIDYTKNDYGSSVIRKIEERINR